MTSYRFETSDDVRQINVSSTGEDHLLCTILKSLFQDEEPSFSLKLLSKITDRPVVVQRVYRQDFEPKTLQSVGAPIRKKMKRRWKSPEPLLNIVRRRQYSTGRMW